MLGRTLASANPILVTARANVALADRPMSMEVLISARTAAPARQIHGVVNAGAGQVNDKAGPRLHLKPVTAPTGARAPPAPRRQTIVPVNPRHLRLTTPVATARVLTAVIAKRMLRLPIILRLHRAPAHVPKAVRILLRRALNEQKPLNADAILLTRRLAMRTTPIKPASRPPMKARPHKVLPVPILMNAVADEVGLVMPIPRAEEALARRLVATNVLTAGPRKNARAPKLAPMA